MQKLLSRLNSLSKYLIAAIILVIPLYPKFPSIRIPGTFVSVRLEDFLMAVVAIFLVISLLPRIKEILKKRTERAILIYLGVGLVSLLSALLITNTVTPHIGLLHWARRIEYFIPFFLSLVYFSKAGKPDLEFFLKVFIVAIFLIFIYGVGQRYANWPVIITQNQEYSKGVALRWIPGSHINSTFAGHYDLATFLVLISPIFVSLFFTLKGKISKLVLGAVILSTLWLLAYAVSRISVASFIFAGSLSLLLLRKYKEIVIFLIVSIIFFGFSTDLLARYTRIFEVTKEKLLYQLPGTVYAQEESVRRVSSSSPKPTPIPVFEDRSTSIRLNVEWPRAIRALSKNPLLGTGYSSITLATDNDYLRALGEIGILGFLAFGLIFVNIIREVIKIVPIPKGLGEIEKSFLAGIIGGSVGVLINGLFIDVFEASKFAIIFWMMMGIVVNFARKYKNEQTI